MRINCIIKDSRSNGPGVRYTIWVQGCSIRCKGCGNLDTWDPDLGTEMSVDEIVKDIKDQEGIEGVTITGGEPLDQYPDVLELLKRVSPLYNVFLTSGYILGTITERFKPILSVVDMLVDGPYIESKKDSNPTWRGSTNQNVTFLSERGKKLRNAPYCPAEIRIGESGKTTITGFNI